MRHLILIFVTTITFGFIFHAITPDFPMRGDTQTFYDPIAKNLAERKGFWLNDEPTARVAPLYPFFMSLVYRAGGNFAAIQNIQIFMLAGIALLSYIIARKFISENFAFFAALNTALWPYLLLYSKLVLTEILFVFAFLAAILSLLNLYKKPTKKHAVLTGALMGIAVLVRPVILFLPFWLILWAILIAVFFHKKDIFSAWKKYLIAISAFLVILMPWTIRNYLQFNEIMPITSGLDASVDRAYVTQDYTEGAVRLAPGEATVFDQMKSRLQNVYLFWNPGAQGNNAQILAEQNAIFNLAFWIYKMAFVFIAALAAFVFFIRKDVMLLGIIILYFWAVHTMLYPYPRYTLPIMPLVIILAWTSVSYIYYEFLKAKIAKK